MGADLSSGVSQPLGFCAHRCEEQRKGNSLSCCPEQGILTMGLEPSHGFCVRGGFGLFPQCCVPGYIPAEGTLRNLEFYPIKDPWNWQSFPSQPHDNPVSVLTPGHGLLPRHPAPTPCASILSPELLMLGFFHDLFLEQLKAFGRFMGSVTFTQRGLDPQHVTESRIQTRMNFLRMLQFLVQHKPSPCCSSEVFCTSLCSLEGLWWKGKGC